MSDEKPRDLIGTTAAGELLGLTSETIRKWVAAGKVRGFRVGRLIKVSETEVLAAAQPIDPDN